MYEAFFHLELKSTNMTLTFFTEPKVCYLHKTISIKQQVVQFQIPEKQKERHSTMYLLLCAVHGGKDEDSPIHNLMVMKELQTQNHTS